MDTILVGMSGGVDSTVTALLLKEQGYDVVGSRMAIWGTTGKENPNYTPKKKSCYGINEEQDAKEVETLCKKLDISFHNINCVSEYNKIVLDNFKSEYSKGHTPNPCVKCNCLIKFGAYPDNAKKQGIKFDKFATGHYARIEQAENGEYTLKRGIDPTKDQSYFLYRLNQEQLSKTLFPLGNYTKDEIRNLAKQFGLEVAEKPDSQDFYSGNYNDLLNFPVKKGNIVNSKGEILGEHEGTWNYTIGQRKGICIAAPQPLYVLSLRPETNEVVVGYIEETFKTSLLADDLSWILPDINHLKNILETKQITAKIRSTQQPVNVNAIIDNDILKVEFEEPQKSISTGQSVVLYDNDTVLGGGIIKETK